MQLFKSVVLNIYYKRGQHHTLVERTTYKQGRNVTTTTGLHIENTRPLQYKLPGKGNEIYCQDK
jgi:hypothetical protein